MARLPAVAPGAHPANNFPGYRSSVTRAPRAAPIAIEATVSETSGPHYGAERFESALSDMTRAPGGGTALGQRIIVHGRVCDEYGRPERNALVEVWQANAAGRYLHGGDQHDAPLDPCFTGTGQALTDADGNYRFVTIEPGAYPWANHHNAWRPKHIHFSLFGATFASRLVTQMYFPGDPTLPFDPIYNAVTDAAARQRLVASFDLEHSVPDHAIAYRFDIVLRGVEQTPLENAS